ncbi:uncharacterized protein LOC111085780 isoform X2 [Limulus polyphemus]|uniref:Uncharacterized protein LOC111085780 isoform X2 n=1 Tax=Limulus polyphemus TaxID=6850 RepID=A0ABM1SDI0_LIMPO|nr:uncharacterized protein LOC111085780 isoform X2 [Limulus polyphemus]
MNGGLTVGTDQIISSRRVFCCLAMSIIFTTQPAGLEGKEIHHINKRDTCHSTVFQVVNSYLSHVVRETAISIPDPFCCFDSPQIFGRFTCNNCQASGLSTLKQIQSPQIICYGNEVVVSTLLAMDNPHVSCDCRKPLFLRTMTTSITLQIPRLEAQTMMKIKFTCPQNSSMVKNLVITSQATPTFNISDCGLFCRLVELFANLFVELIGWRLQLRFDNQIKTLIQNQLDRTPVTSFSEWLK